MTIDSTVVYWFSDVYLYKAVKRTSKLTKILLEMSLSIAKQLQYGYDEICNVIQSWILWNYRLIWILWNYRLIWINIVIACHIGVIFDMIRCISIIWIRIDEIHRNCIHKLYISVNVGYNLDQNKAIGCSLNNNITIMFLIVNVHKINKFYQIVDKIQNFQYNGCIDMPLTKTDALYSIFCHKLHTNSSDSCELHKNGIMQYTLHDSMTTMFTTIKYDKIATNIYKMDQFYQIDGVIHNWNQIKVTAIKSVKDAIAHQIEILIAIYVIISKRPLFIFNHGTFTFTFKFIINHSLYLSTNNMDKFEIITSIINTILTIIAQVDSIYIILIMLAITNDILIHKLDARKNNSKFHQSKTSCCVSKKNKIIAIIVIHYDEFVNIYEMKYFPFLYNHN